jgi:hypothetical protein
VPNGVENSSQQVIFAGISLEKEGFCILILRVKIP